MHLVDVIKFGSRPRSIPVPRLTYRGIADDLAARMGSGEYPAGAQLPSYAQIAELYDVSISTAQRAILVLTERGLVVSEPGRGVFVRD